jgi:hypothetical protein
MATLHQHGTICHALAVEESNSTKSPYEDRKNGEVRMVSIEKVVMAHAKVLHLSRGYTYPEILANSRVSQTCVQAR